MLQEFNNIQPNLQFKTEREQSNKFPGHNNIEDRK
jgi:hypothetical protein